MVGSQLTQFITVTIITFINMTKRQKNNASVKKCREKKKREEEEMRMKTKKLREENAALELSCQAMRTKLELMADILAAHIAAGGEALEQDAEFQELVQICREKI